MEAFSRVAQLIVGCIFAPDLEQLPKLLQAPLSLLITQVLVGAPTWRIVVRCHRSSKLLSKASGLFMLEGRNSVSESLRRAAVVCRSFPAPRLVLCGVQEACAR